MKRLLLLFGLVCAACSDGVSTLDGGPGVVDGGVRPVCQQSRDGGGVVGRGMHAGEPTGCNSCRCEAFPPDGGLGILCTAAACLADAGPANVGPDYPRCTSHAECGNHSPSYNVCLFNQGCDQPFGYCVRVQSFCRAEPAVPATAGDEQVFCGCDGTTYEGDCPVVPYAHAGACK